MNETLHALIEESSAAAERIFTRTGSFRPMWHMITADGQTVMSGPLGSDKDTDVALIKALMIRRNVVRYVFVDEAWMLVRPNSIDPTEMERINRFGLAGHPERKEILMFSAEDQSAGMLTARRAIIRERGRQARLGPLIVDEVQQSEGRMVGLLPAPARGH